MLCFVLLLQFSCSVNFEKILLSPSLKLFCSETTGWMRPAGAHSKFNFVRICEEGGFLIFSFLGIGKVVYLRLFANFLSKTANCFAAIPVLIQRSAIGRVCEEVGMSCFTLLISYVWCSDFWLDCDHPVPNLMYKRGKIFERKYFWLNPRLEVFRF